MTDDAPLTSDLMSRQADSDLMPRQADYRLEALRIAASLYARRGGREALASELDEAVILAAATFTRWLNARPARLVLTVAPTTFWQGNPARHHPTKRTGDPMAVTLTDDQEVSYSVQAEDDKGAPVSDSLTWSADDNGAVVTVTPSEDTMSCVFAAVDPGTATITVTDGNLSASDLITVTAGAAASLVLTPGTPAAEGASTSAPATPAAPTAPATPGTSN